MKIRTSAKDIEISCEFYNFVMDRVLRLTYRAHGKGDIGNPFNLSTRISPLMDPRELSFEQREGLQPIPTQLQRGELSQELRAKLWAYVHDIMMRHYSMIMAGSHAWYDILKDIHVKRDHARVDQVNQSHTFGSLGLMFDGSPYGKVLGWLDFVIRHPKAPNDFGAKVGDLLVECRSAYRVVDGLIVPMATEEERAAFEKALADTSADKFSGARAHLRNAGAHLTNGVFADSIRESISAVESVARILEPGGEFSKALAKLETKGLIHPALKKGFSALYGYTSDQGGIRHALIESGAAAVDEVDAVFFLGACASFVSYLIGKSRNAGFV